ncbi:Hypothetical protein, putative [Bodo saltans]|uniref:Uncharacterized protein n=1 Tax=Bodo saltans TaxID=75058 RepID=A0A0S4KH59_BODSA|nr:Hypothetical protein, putative [Bodo saltans]|eukprot:CUI15052.1 Hypothetical protein, putative [Bodo saltans]
MGSSWAAFSHLGNRTDEPQSLDRSVLEQMKRRKRLLQRESTEFQLIVNQDREARHRVAAAVQRRLELTESVSADAYVPPAVRAGLENLKTELASTSTAWKHDYEQFIHDSTVAKRDAVLALSAPREATNLAMEDAFSRCQEKWRKRVSRLIADFWHTGMEVRCDVMTAVDSALSCLPSNITSPLAPWRTTSNLFGCPLWDPAVVPEMASPVGVEKLILRSADFEECDAPETTPQGETMINDLPIKPVKKRALLDPISSLDSRFKIATPRALPSQTPSIHCSLPEPRERPSLFEEFLINWLQLVALFVDGTSELHHASYRFGQVCIIEVQSLEKHENMSRADVLDSETLFRRLLLRDYLTETELTLSKERMGSKKRNALFTSEKEHRLTLELDQVILRQTELLPAVEKSLRSTIENDRSAFEQAASTSEIDSRLRARATTIFLQQEAALRRSEVQARVRLTWLYDHTHKDLTTTFGQYSV